MPRPELNQVRVLDHSDLNFARSLREEFGQDTAQDLRRLRKLGTWVHRNRDFLKKKRRGEILYLWEAQALNPAFPDNMMASTVKATRDMFERVQVDPWNVEDCTHRLEDYQQRQCIQRAAGRQGVVHEKSFFDIAVYMTILSHLVIPGLESQAHEDWRAFHYACVATGNRPIHVSRLKGIRVLATGLGVKWGDRKIGVEGVTQWIEYPFLWSAVPSDSIVRRLKKWEVVTRRVGRQQGKQASAGCNSWLKKVLLHAGMDQHVTSCCPRVRMVNILLPKVEAGEITPQRYALLMDHTVECAMKKYQRDENVS